jgi:hypothetical protein
MYRMRLAICVLLLISVVLITSSTAMSPVVVSATVSPVTGPSVSVVAGQSIVVTAVGLWRLSNGFAHNGPDGSSAYNPFVSNYYVTTLGTGGSLVGRWGSDVSGSESFFIGSAKNIMVPAGETLLHFGCNDEPTAYVDNEGSVTVTIDATIPVQEATWGRIKALMR